MENLKEVVKNKSKVGDIESSKSEVVVNENTEVFENMISKVAKHLEVGYLHKARDYGTGAT